MRINCFGGSCPDSLNFNWRRYKDGLCELWENKFYEAWFHHGQTGKISGEFKDFSVAYNWLVNECETFSDFKAHVSEGRHWVWETDGSGTHQFDRNMSYVPRIVNHKQTAVDNPDLYEKSSEYRSILYGRSVVVISPEGFKLTFPSAKLCSRCCGFNNSTVYNCCNAKFGSHVSRSGYSKGWAFYWEDEFEEE